MKGHIDCLERHLENLTKFLLLNTSLGGDKAESSGYVGAIIPASEIVSELVRCWNIMYQVIRTPDLA